MGPTADLAFSILQTSTESDKRLAARESVKSARQKDCREKQAATVTAIFIQVTLVLDSQ
jgi:hypothetical protein